MKIELNSDGSKVLFTTQNLKEINTLKKFPGLNKRGMEFWIPAKPNVMHNVFGRLRGKLPGARVSPEVQALREAPFQLLPLPKSFSFFTDPLEHQVLALQHLWTNGSLGLLLDPGLGKTKIVYDYIFLVKTHAPGFTKALVVAPMALMFVWEQEVKKHRPELTTYVVQGVNYDEKIRSREEKLEEPLPPERRKDIEAEIRALKRRRQRDVEGVKAADVVVINYSKLIHAGPFFETFPWSILAIDEGLVKNPYSQQTEVITKISKNCSRRVVMSGTLINNGPEDVFAPVRIIEPSIFGTSFSAFNAYYGVQIKSEGRSFTVGYRNREEIRSGLEAVSLVMRKEDWLHLPDKTFITVPVAVSQAQRDIYEMLAGNYIATLPNGDVIEAENPLSVSLMLGQISNGFVYSYDEEQMEDSGLSTITGVGSRRSGEGKKKKRKLSERRTYTFAEQPKLDALEKLLQEDVSQERMVLWYNFSEEARLIRSRLDLLEITYRQVGGGCGNTGATIDEFNTDPTIQVLLCQAKAVNYGVTLLGTSLDSLDYEPELSPEIYVHVYYSLNYSLEVFIQQQDRSHRIGLVKPPRYYILQADTPFEEAVYTALLAKKEIREEFLIDITKRVRGPK